MSKRRSQRSRGTGSLYKQTKGGPWIAAWYDHDGKRRTRSTRTTDRAAAERILAKYVADAALRRDGVIDPAAEQVAEQRRRPLAEHAADWRRHLEAKGNTAKHVKHMAGMLDRLTERMGARTLADLTPAAVQSAIAELHEQEGMSRRTCNMYQTAVKGFTRWATGDGRLTADPLAGLKRYNAATDRKRRRRPLTPEEAAALVETTESGPDWRSVSGADRAMLYRVALGTGFRKAELASLTPGSFDLDAEPPAVTVDASHSKHRRDDRQPIRGDLADLRRARAAWIRATDDPQERRERRESGFLAREDAEGRVVDFHALRATYVTMLVKGGASVKEAQELARHSDPRLTMNVYTKLGIHDLAGALNGLPAAEAERVEEIAEADAVSARATGTDGNRPRSARCATDSARESERGAAVRRGALDSRGRPGSRKPRNPAISAARGGSGRRRAGQCDEYAREDSNPQPADPKSAALSN